MTATVADAHLLTATEITTSTGATYRQIDHWTRQGYIRTDGRPSPGSGITRQYPVEEAAVVAYMVRACRFGVSPERAAHAARHDGELGPGAYLVLDQAADAGPVRDHEWPGG